MSYFGWKLCMYWGSHWRTYFGLYYAHTFEEAHAALKHYNFPQSKKQGWAIKDVIGKETYFSYAQYMGRDENTSPEPAPVEDAEPLVPENELGVLFLQEYSLAKRATKRRL